jgi:paired amphipathic helix protein Sin3a
LVKKSRNFFGDSELIRQFGDILGWTETKEREYYLAERQSPNGWTRPAVVGIRDRPGRVDLKIQDGGYRK